LLGVAGGISVAMTVVAWIGVAPTAEREATAPATIEPAPSGDLRPAPIAPPAAPVPAGSSSIR
jgi:hypothetical protein